MDEQNVESTANEDDPRNGGHAENDKAKDKLSPEQIERAFGNQFTAAEIEQWEADAVDFEQLGKGKVLDTWLAVLPKAQSVRERAMCEAYVNKPKGRTYNELFRAFLLRFYPSLNDKTTKAQITALLWL